jgi:hypothetical protein
MSLLARLLAVAGWRTMAIAAAGAAVAAVPAWHTGRWMEERAAEARCARDLAQWRAEWLEAENDRIGKAAEARHRAGLAPRDGDGGGGLPDDGFRRD